MAIVFFNLFWLHRRMVIENGDTMQRINYQIHCTIRMQLDRKKSIIIIDSAKKQSKSIEWFTDRNKRPFNTDYKNGDPMHEVCIPHRMILRA